PGHVGEGQWQAFLSKEVTPRFPDGLTVWEADRQWRRPRRPDRRISRERAKALLPVYEEMPAVRTLAAASWAPANSISAGLGNVGNRSGVRGVRTAPLRVKTSTRLLPRRLPVNALRIFRVHVIRFEVRRLRIHAPGQIQDLDLSKFRRMAFRL